MLKKTFHVQQGPVLSKQERNRVNGGRMERERGSLFLFYFSCAPATCNYSSPRVYYQQPAEAHCTQKRSHYAQLHKNSRRVITSDCAMRVIKTIVENVNRSQTGHERESNGNGLSVQRAIHGKFFLTSTVPCILSGTVNTYQGRN